MSLISQSVLQVLEVRFPQVPWNLEAIAEQLALIKDIERLDALLGEAVRTASPEAFREFLAR